MKHFTFVKLSNRWFVDIPYDGCVSDLEMVGGADTLIESYARSRVVDVYIPESEADFTDSTFVQKCHYATLIKKCRDVNGTTYDVNSSRYRSEIWLCPVFNMLMGESPEKMTIGICK